MHATRLFGTDGIRGLANEYPLTPEGAVRFGRAVAHAFLSADSKQRPFLIGRDTRVSGPMLESAVAAGMNSMGAEVILAGVLPTPAVARLTRELNCAAGIVISASHNSFEDNGLKIFQGTGYKCDDALETRLSELIVGADLNDVHPTGAKVGSIRRLEAADSEYAEKIATEWKHLDLHGMHLVVDTANGAAWKTTPQVLRALGAEVTSAFDQPDGININAGCGSTHPEALCKLVSSKRADIGIAHDGDADRVLFCDESATVLDGDEVLAILALEALDRGKLRHQTVVATTMSNLGLDECIQAAGGKVLRANVGDRYVLEQMLEHDLNIGGEQSGHVILRDYNTTGDGLATALALLHILRRRGQPLSQLRKVLRKYPQKLYNVPIKERRPLQEMPEVAAALASLEAELGATGRAFLRFSGTEMLARLLIESREEAKLDAMAEKVLAPLRKAIGK